MKGTTNIGDPIEVGYVMKSVAEVVLEFMGRFAGHLQTESG